MSERDFYKIIKRQKYLGFLFQYGFITLCYLIDKYEKEENYEECEIIIDCINEVNEIKGLALPTKYNDTSINIMKDYFKDMGLNGEIAASNIPYYAHLIESEIKNIEK